MKKLLTVIVLTAVVLLGVTLAVTLAVILAGGAGFLVLAYRKQ